MFSNKGQFKFVSNLILAENCESARENDSLIYSISKNGIPGILGNDILTISIVATNIASKCLCLKAEDSENPD